MIVGALLVVLALNNDVRPNRLLHFLSETKIDEFLKNSSLLWKNWIDFCATHILKRQIRYKIWFNIISH